MDAISKTCSICSLTGEPMSHYLDGADPYDVCQDCLSVVNARSQNSTKWYAFVMKHGDGGQWFDRLPLPAQPINKLQCK